MTPAAVAGSSPDVGSSRKKSRGAVSSSTPMLARLRSPPESDATLASARPLMASSSSTALTRLPISVLAVPLGSRSLAAYVSVRRTVSSPWMMSPCGT